MPHREVRIVLVRIMDKLRIDVLLQRGETSSSQGFEYKIKVGVLAHTEIKVALVMVRVCWLVDCLTPQQQASASHGRIYSDNFTCCHTEIEVADQTFHLTQSQYTDTGPATPLRDAANGISVHWKKYPRHCLWCS